MTGDRLNPIVMSNDYWTVALDDHLVVTKTYTEHSCRGGFCDCGPEIICTVETPELAKQIAEEHNRLIDLEK